MAALQKVLKTAALYLSAVSVILVPLYMKNSYFGLNEAKAGICLRFTAPVALAALLLDAGVYLYSVRLDGYHLHRVRISAFLLTAIAGWSLFSSYLSPDPGLSFRGTVGWSVGSALTAILVTSTFLISRNLSFQPNQMFPVIFVNAGIIFIAILQSAGIDPFGLLHQVDPAYRYTYLSTIGQKNAAAGYFCLLVPLFWGFFVSCTDQFSAIVYGGISILGSFGIILCESDSAYAGIGICMLFMIPYFFSELRRVRKTGILLCAYGVCLLIIGSAPIFADKAEGMRGLSLILLKLPCALSVTVLGGFICFAAGKLLREAAQTKETQEKYEKTLLKVLVILLEIILVTAILVYVFYTIAHFSDDWGTMRGRTWRIGMEEFLKFPLQRKLTGIGPEMLAMLYSQLRMEQRINIVTAHSDPLQILFAQGIVGAVLYLLFWGYLLSLFFRKKLWRENNAIFFFPLAAYFGQSLFCSVYPVTGVLFSVMAGLYLGKAET